jgi:hypothetical protein
MECETQQPLRFNGSINPVYASFRKHLCSQKTYSEENSSLYVDTSTMPNHPSQIQYLEKERLPSIDHRISHTVQQGKSSFEELLRATNSHYTPSPTNSETSISSTITDLDLPEAYSTEIDNAKAQTSCLINKENTTTTLMHNGEEVWSPKVEAAFQDALVRYPSIGRAKLFIEEEGRYYGKECHFLGKYYPCSNGRQ